MHVLSLPTPTSQNSVEDPDHGCVGGTRPVMASVVEPPGCLVFFLPTPWRWSGVGLCQAWGQCQPTDGGVLLFFEPPPPSGLGKDSG